MFRLVILCIMCFGINLLSGQEQTMGLFYNLENSYNGYTLMSNNETSYLIDNCGEIVNQWESEYKAGTGLYLLDNGDLLRAGKLFGDFNAGGRGGIFERFDWDGNLQWSFILATDKIHAHHDVEPLPNGNFLCVIWEKMDEAEAKQAGRAYDGEVWSCKIIELEMLGNNDAKVVWEWSVWDHLVQDHDPTKSNFGTIRDHPELIDLNYIGEGEDTFGNWLHVNSIDYHPEFDQILISSRNMSEFYVIDHSTSTAEAAGHQGGNFGKGGDILFRYGNPQVYDRGNTSDQVLRRQHDVHWVYNEDSDNWNFMLFNNDYIQYFQSAVQIIDNPADDDGNYSFDINEGFGEVEILYTYSTDQLYSSILSSAQQLPNGNMLILEGKAGHIFEIDSNEEMVWDYIFPVNVNGGPGIQTGTPQFNSLFRAQRYTPEFKGFEGRNLIPIAPIELSPIDNSCEIFSNPSSNSNLNRESIKIVNPLVANQLIIECPPLFCGDCTIELRSLNGHLMFTSAFSPGNTTFTVDDYQAGLYVLVIYEGQLVKHIEKLFKI